MKTHCPQGHKYNKKNTYFNIRGHYTCRKCRNIAVKKFQREQPIAKKKAQRKEYVQKLKEEFLNAFGNKCQCDCGCQETTKEFLTLDHIFNDGGQKRKKGIKTFGELKTLRKLGWPKDKHRLACFNCNLGRNYSENRICPRITHV